MEYSGKIVEKFVKYLTPDSVLLDEMVIRVFIICVCCSFRFIF